MNHLIALWAHPRSRSTALERVFIERGDFHVLHEPFAALYYQHEQRAAAVKSSLDAEESCDYATIRNRLLGLVQDEDLFFKDMCYHCHDHLKADQPLLQRMTHVFLVRDPKPTIASHFAKNPCVTLEEIGYEKQASIFRQVQAVQRSMPIVVCAETLVAHPTSVLSELCQRLEIAFDAKSLNWSAGQHDKWQQWQGWHEEVANSQGLHRENTEYEQTVENNPTLAEYYDYHLPYYEEMHQHRIVADEAL
ncbi:sulfotransferase-like domain-containing protein [Aeoliella mucimassa]|uniref:Sulfotransferase family protein n=1 Tax=Aeoliella mucimassa TaxID=2527972 RepID=A0A518AW45_9BACT|nr:hypothetical protein [Aeoliella mucimassa]QDU58930.1 hypothetical protein Pan181_51710 [Aeoliella mucimassa]